MKLLALLLLLVSSCARLNHPVPDDPSALSHSRPSAPAPAKLRVATYNVHMEPAAKIAAAVRGNPHLRAADILLFQEIEDHVREGRPRAAALAEELGMSYAYAPGYKLREGGSHGVAILSRYALEDIEIIELPYYSTRVNSARRVALAASIDVQGTALRVYSVHLDNRVNPAKRRKQFAPVLRAASKFKGPVVIGGDLNTSPFCWIGNLLPLPCGLQDNAVESGARANGFATPVADIGATAKWFAMKLDAIYVRGLQPGQSAVEHSVRISDHLPMWLDLEV